MAWSDRTDRVLVASMREFGQAITYTPVGGVAGSSVGIFDADYQLVALGGDVEITAVGPVLGVRLADFTAPPAKGDAVTIGSASYTVRSVHLDGQGGAKLLLAPA